MNRPDDPREDFRRACKSLDRIGAALQVIAVIVLVIGTIMSIVELKDGGTITPLCITIATAVIFYTMGAVFDWFNRFGLYMIEFAERSRPK